MFGAARKTLKGKRYDRKVHALIKRSKNVKTFEWGNRSSANFQGQSRQISPLNADGPRRTERSCWT